MTKEESMISKRLSDQAQKAYMENRYVYTRFLNTMEQDLLLQLERELPIAVSLYGGTWAAERKIAVFGSEEEFGYGPDLPFELLKIEPVSKKFGEDLAHRDVLGAVLNLGIERELIGDIFVKEKEVYLFCMNTITDYILTELTRIRHTVVKMERCDVEELQLESSQGEELMVLTSSLRLDAVVASVYHLSRQQSQLLIREKRVAIDGRISENNSGLLTGSQMISVRGKGRFFFQKVVYETKKGKYQIGINLF